MDFWKRVTESHIYKSIVNTIGNSANPDEIEEAIVITSYLLSENNEKGYSFKEILEGKLGISEDVLLIAKTFLNEEKWQTLMNEHFDEEELKFLSVFAYRGHKRQSNTTPTSLVDLANWFLDIHSARTVADLGCGYGDFLSQMGSLYKNAHYYGYEINAVAKAIADIRTRRNRDRVTIHLCNALSLLTEENRHLIPPEGFDRIFTNYTFGQRARRYTDLPAVKQLMKHFTSLKKANSADWIFNAMAAELLNEGGKAICITTNASMWNSLDRQVRKQFVEEGLVKTVLSLPADRYSYNSVPVCMMVLSHGNKKVSMVNVSDMFKWDAFDDEYFDDDFKGDDTEGKIWSIYNCEDPMFCKDVSLEEIRANDYCLHPERYIRDDGKEDPDGVQLEEIISRITRGMPKAPELLECAEGMLEKKYRYISISNIIDGIVDDYLPYVSGDRKKLDKYCVNDESLILSKVGYPFKVGLIKAEEDVKIVANGNVYIIDIDRSKADPVYVKAFLESERGQTLLKTSSSGMSVMTLGAEALKKIKIPLIPMEKQLKVREAYLAAQDEYQIQQKRYYNARFKLQHIFESEMGECTIIADD